MDTNRPQFWEAHGQIREHTACPCLCAGGSSSHRTDSRWRTCGFRHSRRDILL